MVNQDFVEVTEPYLKIMIIAWLPLGLILCAIIRCYPKFASWILYYELISTCMIQGFIPFNYGDFGHLVSYMAVCTTFVLFADDLGPSIIACTIFLTFDEFCALPLVYKD